MASKELNECLEILENIDAEITYQKCKIALLKQEIKESQRIINEDMKILEKVSNIKQLRQSALSK